MAKSRKKRKAYYLDSYGRYWLALPVDVMKRRCEGIVREIGNAIVACDLSISPLVLMSRLDRILYEIILFLKDLATEESLEVIEVVSDHSKMVGDPDHIERLVASLVADHGIQRHPDHIFPGIPADQSWIRAMSADGSRVRMKAVLNSLAVALDWNISWQKEKYFSEMGIPDRLLTVSDIVKLLMFQIAQECSRAVHLFLASGVCGLPIGWAPEPSELGEER